MSVTNIADSILYHVFGEVVGISNSSIVTSSGGYSGPVSLNSGESIEFNFTYSADSAGLISWQLHAIAGDVFDSSAVLETDEIQIQNAPDLLSAQLINSAPASVTRGQINIFPIGLNIEHPNDDDSVASLRLDSLKLKVTDGSGTAIAANSVFSRIVLSSEYHNLSIIDSVTDDTEILFAFESPVIIAPDNNKTFTLLVDIDSLALADNFALSFERNSSIPVVDNNNGQLVAFDVADVFPKVTDVCRIDDASRSMVVAYQVTHSGHANYGQNDFDLINLDLRHPGLSGSSPIQLTGLSMKFVDSLGTEINASQLFDELKLARDQFIVGNSSGSDLNQSEIIFSLNSPLTLNAGDLDSLRVLASIKDESALSKFGMVIIDSTSFFVRDLSSGASLVTETDTTLATEAVFPIMSGLVNINQPAIASNVCIASELPTSVAGGTDSVSLISLKFKYPLISQNYAPVYLKNALVSVIDSFQSPLDPDQLFDRIGVSIDGGAINYQSFIPMIAGLMQFDFENDIGILLNPGDSVVVTLVADIEADVPYSHFMISLNSNAIVLYDAIDTNSNPGVEVSIGCANSIPYESNVAQVYLPAGKPEISIDPTSVLMAYPGQSSITVLDGIWSYTGNPLQGNIILHRIRALCLQRTTTGLLQASASDIFDTMTVIFDDLLIPQAFAVNSDTIDIDLQNLVELQSGLTADFQIICKLKDDAPVGNYLISLMDSSYIGLTDKNLGLELFPDYSASSFPIYSKELSISTFGLKESFTNYPNPFNPVDGGYTTIGFLLNEPANVDIELFTITGDKVSDLALNDYREAGEHQTDIWAGLNDIGQKVISGTYICRITARFASGKTEEYTRKIAVIR